MLQKYILFPLFALVFLEFLLNSCAPAGEHMIRKMETERVGHIN